MTRSRVIVKEVYRGHDSDDDEETSAEGRENERSRRGKLFCDGWIDDETTLRTGIPIARKAARDFYVGQRTVEWRDRAWAEGDEKTGLIVVENDLGSVEEITYTWSYNLPDKGGGSILGRSFWKAKRSDFLLINWSVMTDNEGAQFALYLDYEFGIPDEETNDMIASTPNPKIDFNWEVESDLLLYRVPRGSHLSIDVWDGGADANVIDEASSTAMVTLREIPGS